VSSCEEIKRLAYANSGVVVAERGEGYLYMTIGSSNTWGLDNDFSISHASARAVTLSFPSFQRPRQSMDTIGFDSFPL